MSSTFYLLGLFVFTIVYKAMFKKCSGLFDPRTVPIFVSLWVLIGLGLSAPWFHSLWFAAWDVYKAAPYLMFIAVGKGALLYLSQTSNQRLMRVSLSSSLYVWPMAVGIIAAINAVLGEHLSDAQWFSALAVCALSCGFFFYGHLRELDAGAKRLYALIICLCVSLAAIDQFMVARVNWYGLLLPSNITLLVLALFSVRHERHILGHALWQKTALAAGASFAFVEILKFYQMVTVNPVTAVIMTQNLTNPVLLAASAYIWKERTVKEQLIWGALAVALSLPLFLG